MTRSVIVCVQLMFHSPHSFTRSVCKTRIITVRSHEYRLTLRCVGTKLDPSLYDYVLLIMTQQQN